MTHLRSALAACLAFAPLPAFAQSTFATPVPGQTAQAVVPLCSNGATPPQYVPCNASGSSPTLPPGAATSANQTAGTPVNGTAQTGGVAPLARLVSSAASTNATVAKASAGRVYRVFACNTTTTAVYLKFYNVATTPVPGTTAVFLSRALPAAGAAGGLACQSFDVADIGWSFSTGIAFALTTGNADTDATAPVAGAVTQLSVDGM